MDKILMYLLIVAALLLSAYFADTCEAADVTLVLHEPDTLVYTFGYSQNRLLYMTHGKGRNTLYLYSLADGKKLDLTTDRISGNIYAYFPPKSNLVLLSGTGIQDDKNHLFIYSLDAETFSEISLTRPGDFIGALSATPDGKVILFEVLYPQEQGPGGMDINIMDTSDGSVRRLTNHPAKDRYPAISPDGRYVAFASRRGTTGYDSDIYIIKADGTGDVKRLTTDMNAIHPCWLPDGKAIIFVSYAEGSRGIWKVSAEGGEPTQIFSGRVYKAVVSDDGQAIIFSRREKEHRGNIYLLKLPDK